MSTLLLQSFCTLGIVILYVLIALVLKKYKIGWLHQNGVGILLGILYNVIWENPDFYKYGEPEFMYFLLPGVLFVDGYLIQKRTVMKNIKGIVYYGFLGTYLFYVLLHYANKYYFEQLGGDFKKLVEEHHFAYITAALVATKSITALSIVHHKKSIKDTYGLIFGSAIFNDILTIGIFESLLEHQSQGDKPSQYFDIVMWVNVYSNLILGTILGILGGLIASLITKFVRYITPEKQHPNAVFEALLVFSLGFFTYQFSEMYKFNGPCSIIIFAMTFRHYGWYNLSLKGIIITKGVIEIIGTSFEAILFIGLGIKFETYYTLMWEIKWVIVQETCIISIVWFFVLITLYLLRMLYIYTCLSKVRRNQILSKEKHLFDVLLLWSNGKFKGIISFILMFQYVEEFETEEDKELLDLALTIVFGLVISSQLLYAALFPYIIDGLIHVFDKIESKKLQHKTFINEQLKKQGSDSLTVIIKKQKEENKEKNKEKTSKTTYQRYIANCQKALNEFFICKKVQNNKKVYKFLKNDKIELGFNSYQGQIILGSHNLVTKDRDPKFKFQNSLYGQTIRDATQLTNFNIRDATQLTNFNIRDATELTDFNTRDLTQLTNFNIRDATELTDFSKPNNQQDFYSMKDE